MVCIIKGWFSKANPLFFLPFNTHLGERWTSTLESISLRSSVFIPNLCSKAGHSTSAVFAVFMRRKPNMSPAAQGCHFCPQEESCISETGNWSYRHLKLDCRREHPNCCIYSPNICCVPIILPAPQPAPDAFCKMPCNSSPLPILGRQQDVLKRGNFSEFGHKVAMGSWTSPTISLGLFLVLDQMIIHVLGRKMIKIMT